MGPFYDTVPGEPDLDGDGHCVQGTYDPTGVCTTFNDCDDADASRYPNAPETCKDEGVDNDCDGDSDDVDEDGDGVDDLNEACTTSLPGVCTDGTRQCDAGALVCQPTIQVGQQSEQCNGSDDDCDGETDEGSLCDNGNTCEGVVGCRCGAMPPCSGSKECCPSGCMDLSSDVKNCGACGATCGANETCDSGRCKCGSTLGTQGGGAVCPNDTCLNGACVTCDPAANLAPQAVASSSGGGYVAGYEPLQMNDGQLQSTCKFHWVSAESTPTGKWVQLTWPGPVTFSNIWFDTAPPSGICGMSAGRTLAGGTIQYHDGTSWVTLSTVSGKTGDWSASFAKVSASKLRLYDLVAINSGYAKNPMIFEWRVFCK
jgi:hypothetical protein